MAVSSCLIWGLSSEEALTTSTLLGMLSGVVTMALGFSTSLFKERSSYSVNWSEYITLPCTAQLMPSFVTFLSVVYTAVTERIN